MNIKELQEKNDAELRKDLSALREKIRSLRFKMNSQEVKNLKESADIRKTIARILTILKQREVNPK
jgi:large subunit ribosomal protein L29